MSNITYHYIKQNKDVQTYINYADAALESIGYTEHSNAHVERAAETAYSILHTLGYSERECELAQIAAYMHDIGNVVNRTDHAQTGAVMAFRLLDTMAMPAEEIATIISAIGNHDEKTAMPVNPIAAALILADKMDVRRSRVRLPIDGKDLSERIKKGFVQDVHDRVNYACVESRYYFNDDNSKLILDLIIDPEFSSIMDYFEIFLDRMKLCKNAAEAIGTSFQLMINNTKIM